MLSAVVVAALAIVITQAETCMYYRHTEVIRPEFGTPDWHSDVMTVGISYTEVCSTAWGTEVRSIDPNAQDGLGFECPGVLSLVRDADGEVVPMATVKCIP